MRDASILVGTFEFDQRIDVRSYFAGHLSFMRRRPIHTNNNAFAIDGINHTGALANNHSTGITSRYPFHTCAHKRGFSTKQRYSLTLHVGTHQGSVSVIVFKERNQAGSYRNKLFRTDVHVLHFLAMNQDEVALLTGVHQIVSDFTHRIQLHVRLSNDVLIFFPRRQIIAMGFNFSQMFASLQVAIHLFHFDARDNLVHLG